MRNWDGRLDLVTANDAFIRESSISVGEYEKWSENLKHYKHDINIDIEKRKNGKKLISYRYNLGPESGFWCEQCNYLDYRKLHGSGSTSVEIDDPDDEITDQNLPEDLIDFSFFSKIKCPNENHIFTNYLNQLDPNIAEAIRILNKKGYKTDFSCESHKKYGGDSPAYICFELEGRWAYKYIIGYDLPFGWYIDLKELKENRRLVIKADYNDSKDYLFDLLKWAESLPYMKYRFRSRMYGIRPYLFVRLDFEFMYEYQFKDPKPPEVCCNKKRK